MDRGNQWPQDSRVDRGKEGYHALARLLCSSLSHTGSNELQTALEGRTVTRGGGDGGRRRVDDDGAADGRILDGRRRGVGGSGGGAEP